MSALAYSLPNSIHHPRLRLVTPVTTQSMAQVYWRRRLMALVALLLLTSAAVMAVQAGVARISASTPQTAVAASALPAPPQQLVKVRPGDTLWSIASRSNPGADVRPLVTKMAANRDNRPLQVGEVIAVPR